MSDQVYKDMIEVMNKRGALLGGMDIPEYYNVVEHLFSVDEAKINNAMPNGEFTAKDMAEIMGRDESEVAAVLRGMANKGLCNSFVRDETRYFRGSGFEPGIFEFVFYRGGTSDWDKKAAHLIHEYEEVFKAKLAGILPPFPMQRAITVDRTIEPGNTIHTYDQVKTYIENTDEIAVGKCYCRHSALLRDLDTHGMPMETCMFFGNNAQFGADCLGARRVSKEEAFKILDESEEAGLVHQTSNFAEGISYLCNCDRWHCNSIQITLNQAKILNTSGFEPRFDADLCIACETCVDRCPARVIAIGDDDVAAAEMDRCFGCAVCATGCPEEAISMVNKPGFEEPPKDRIDMREKMIASLKARLG